MWLTAFGRDYFGAPIGASEASAFFDGSQGGGTTFDLWSMFRTTSVNNDLRVDVANNLNYSLWVKPGWQGYQGWPVNFFAHHFLNTWPNIGDIKNYILFGYDTETAYDSFYLQLYQYYEVDTNFYVRNEAYAWAVADPPNDAITGVPTDPSGRGSWNANTGPDFTNLQIHYVNEYYVNGQVDPDHNTAALYWNGQRLDLTYQHKLYQINGVGQGGNYNPQGSVNLAEFGGGAQNTKIDLGSLDAYFQWEPGDTLLGQTSPLNIDKFIFDNGQAGAWNGAAAQTLYGGGSPGQTIINPSTSFLMDMQNIAPNNWYDPDPGGTLNVQITPYHGSATGDPTQDFTNYVP